MIDIEKYKTLTNVLILILMNAIIYFMNTMCVISRKFGIK